VAKNQQLGDMARDYFYFVTKFFAVIDVSASHIYRSALAVSPQSSLIREHYYCEPFWHAKPRVLFGLPNSWDQTMILHDHFASHTWSPCGQYFSTLSETSVQEWNATTLEKRSNLHPRTATRTVERRFGTDYFPGALAYSPDGHSLACLFDSVIVIWDLQTGGVINEIETNSGSLVWSSDGTAIYTPSWVDDETWVVTAYNITSGTEVYTNMVQSSVKPYLWLCDTSLWVMAMVYHTNTQATVNILEIQPNSINNLIESFPIKGLSRRVSFSPSTYRISTIIPATISIGTLLVLDIRSSKVLLQREVCNIASGSCFSPDGSLLVAADGQCDILIWKYTSEQSYTLLTKLPGDARLANLIQGYQFSPSSILSLSFIERLEVHLEGLRPNPLERNEYYTGFFNSGTCVITASSSGSTFTSVNLQKGSSQCIDTKFKIHKLAVTGSILLVQGEDMVAGWKLTNEGTVDKDLDNGMGDCIWWHRLAPEFTIKNMWISTHHNIGGIKTSQDLMFYYNMETGVAVDSMTAYVPSLSSSSWGGLWACCHHPSTFPGYHYLLRTSYPTEDDLKTNRPWLQKGWVKYAKGEHQHQLWLPPEWRYDDNWFYWVENFTALVLQHSDHPSVVIKF